MDCCGKSKSKTRRWSWIILLIVVAIVVLIAVLSDARGQTPADGAAPAITNQTCPVTVGEPIDPEQWVEHEGQRVYFCCRMCKRKFERDPQAYLANLPQFADAGVTTNGGTASDDDHGDHAHEADAPGEHTVEPAHDHAAPTSDHDSAITTDGHGDASADGDDSAGHDHAAHEYGGSQTGLAKLIGWLGNFHPPSVNFPIALLMSGAMAELLLMATGRSFFDAAARFCVWMGALSTVPAVVLGWFFAGFRLSDPDWIITLHRWLGTAAGVWAIIVLLLCIAAHRTDERRQRWLPWYRLALFVGALAVAVNGFFGGAMIYGLDHYAW